MGNDKVVIRARNLTKKFNDFTAVDGISFEVKEGECIAFLGPNGAGKTSTMRMISCISPKTSGELFVLGLDVEKQPAKIKSLIGIVPQENNLDVDFSLFENLLIYASYFGIPRQEAKNRAIKLLEFVQLLEKKDVNVDKLSTGMKRRAVFARALLNNPKLLILDEPTTGLDPQARHLVWDCLRELKRSGITIILATHYMEEAEQLCDRVLIMDRGRILVEAPPRELIQKFIGSEVLELFYSDQRLISQLKSEGVNFEVASDRIYIFDCLNNRLLNDMLQFKEYARRKATLEDVFLKLTGRRLRE
ncbi:MAG: ABC transporter ATP-binding protein [Methanocellales archaeon]